MATQKALLIVDVQNDFCPGGALPAERGDEVVPILNEYARLFADAGYLVYASRDWHPRSSAHFQERGGPWPPHCVQGTEGAEFHPDLELPESASVLTKGEDPEEDEGYSAFEGTTAGGDHLPDELHRQGIEEVFIGGLATDYCVRASAIDAVKNGLRTHLLLDAIRGVDVDPGDSERAIEELKRDGVHVAMMQHVKAELDEE